jgi:hypothetical protein
MRLICLILLTSLVGSGIGFGHAYAEPDIVNRTSRSDSELLRLKRALGYPDAPPPTKPVEVATLPPSQEITEDAAKQREAMITRLSLMSENQLEKARLKSLADTSEAVDMPAAEVKSLRNDINEFYDTLKILNPEQRKHYLRVFR